MVHGRFEKMTYIMLGFHFIFILFSSRSFSASISAWCLQHQQYWCKSKVKACLQQPTWALFLPRTQLRNRWTLILVMHHCQRSRYWRRDRRNWLWRPRRPSKQPKQLQLPAGRSLLLHLLLMSSWNQCQQVQKAADSKEEAPNAEGSDEGSHLHAWSKDGTSSKNDSVSEAESNIRTEGLLSKLDSSKDEKKLSSWLKHMEKAIEKSNCSKGHHGKNAEHCKVGTFKFKDRHFVSLDSFQLKFVSMAATGHWGCELALPEISCLEWPACHTAGMVQWMTGRWWPQCFVSTLVGYACCFNSGDLWQWSKPFQLLLSTCGVACMWSTSRLQCWRRQQ